jgi:hypothetical protein
MIYLRIYLAVSHHPSRPLCFLAVLSPPPLCASAFFLGAGAGGAIAV